MRKRRRRWRAPNNPTGPAKQVWEACFPGHRWPSGWRVKWAGFMRGALGLTIFDSREILLSYADARRMTKPNPAHGQARGVVAVLIHEFVHVRSPKLRHGAEFRAIETRILTSLGLMTEKDPMP